MSTFSVRSKTPSSGGLLPSFTRTTYVRKSVFVLGMGGVLFLVVQPVLNVLKMDKMPTTTHGPPACDCSTAECAKARLLSYSLPSFFPFPSLPMVMESSPGSCDLCSPRADLSPSPCELISSKALYEPDAHVREALASALIHCAIAPAGALPCHVLDGGGNMGFFSLYAFALGAKVVYVEPQIDLVEAMRATIALNCASDQITVIHAALSPSEQPQDSRLHLTLPAFRSCQGVWGAASKQGGAGPGGAPFVSVDSLARLQRHWDLVKIDIDSTDSEIIERFVELIRSGAVSVTSFIVEWNGGHTRGAVLHALQQELGYDVYRLNVHDNRRFINETGWDTIAGFGKINIEPYFEERLQQRFMRYVLKVRSLPRIEDWTPIASWGMMPEFFITKLPMSEPQRENENKQKFRRPP